MKKLKYLHEKYISESLEGSTIRSTYPLVPKPEKYSIVMETKWEKEGETLKKTFIFNDLKTKARFINELMNFERKTKHCANILILEYSIEITLYTRFLNQITSLDKEYAKFANLLYKELSDVRELKNENRQQ